tara:strand:+ start:1220 stop:3721 length:2502 start_codon:yes stop_codon:yes gene_type:complete
MSLVSYNIPNLVQGVSQQPDAQRDPSQGEIQVNGMSSIVEGLRKRDPSETLALVSNSDFGDCFIHEILRDNVEEYLAVITSSSIKVFDLDGAEQTVSAPGGYGYLSNVTDAKSQIRAVTIADYTFITNTLKVPAMTSDTAPVVARPATNEALIWVRAASYGQRYRVNVNGTEVTVQTAVAPVVSDGSSVTENRISSEDIAQNIINGFSSLSGVSFARSGAVIHVTSSSAITISVTDARSGADISAIFNKVQAFTELPTVAPTGYQVTIEGDPGNSFDDYHVSFLPKSGTFGEGTWSETVKPGDKYKIDKDLMPHLLIRLPNGTFYFGPANGTTQNTVVVPTWGERISGDTTTAPDPSFIGYPINDIFIYKNRLGFLADENVILSRVRSFFDFFPETVTAVLDTDPIDVVASNNRVSVLKYAVPYQDELILFSSQYQFRFNAAETVLTPATAQITVLTQFEIDTNVRPQLAGGGIIFTQANGDFSQFREFSVRGAGTALTADAQDLSGYVSAFVPSSIHKVTVNDTSNALFAVSNKTGFKDRIYVYKYFVRSTGNSVERAQSSWSYWDFAGADEILQILCVRETLFCLVRYGTKIYLEKIPAQDRSPEPPAGSPYPLLLDRRVSTETETPTAMRVANGTYNANTQTTTWTLPYAAEATTQAWSGFSSTSTGGVLLSTITSGTTMVANGDWRNKPIYFGEAYEFRYRFTKFKLYKEIGGGKAAANVERTQVRHAKLRYHETAYFDIEVTAERRDTSTYKFDGTVLGVRESLVTSTLPAGGYSSDDDRYKEGVFNIPIMSKGERCVVEIKNDTAHPCKFSTCEWVALITRKASALR